MPRDERRKHEVPRRLWDARYILAAALAVAFGLAFTAVGPVAAAAGFAAIVAAALLPTRPRALYPDERRPADAAVRASDAARDAVLEALDFPVFLLTADGTLVHANEAAVARHGPIVAGAHLSSRIRAPDILAMVREAAAGGREAMLEHAERVPAEQWWQVRLAPVGPPPLSDAAPRLFLLTFRDLTEARRADRMRSDFVANASHELRTPLASLKGFIETLQGPARGDADARSRFLAIMHDQAERMSRLVDDLMALSRLELRAPSAPLERIDLVALVGDVCEILKPMATDLGVTIRYDRPEESAFVAGARDELVQVFQNLVENACKYGQDGSFVDVALRGPGDGTDTPEGMLDVAVRDYGPGIAPEHLPRLTERFYRVNVEASRTKKGTGLGLAIVKHILTRHGGRLVIRSQPGRGSVFVARIPSA